MLDNERVGSSGAARRRWDALDWHGFAALMVCVGCLAWVVILIVVNADRKADRPAASPVSRETGRALTIGADPDVSVDNYAVFNADVDAMCRVNRGGSQANNRENGIMAGESTGAVLTPTTFNDGDLVRIADESRFHDMIGVVTGTREMKPVNAPPTEPGEDEIHELHVDLDVQCEHLVKHRCTVLADKVHPTGGAL